MYGKILIRCELIVRTGMHIGGSSAFSAIGAVDSPVVRDCYTGLPIVPGSSLKGKLRTLLARSVYQDIDAMAKAGNCNKDPEQILRLFGASEPVRRSRLQFADAFLTNEKALSNVGVTEVKTENAISRATSVANPRQIERVIAGAAFGVSIVYDVTDPAQVEEDLALLAKGMKLLQLLNERKDKSGIVYCSTRKNVEEICDLLLSRGLPATRYHAGLDPEERRENQDDFLYDRKTIMVATNAFGMGIDKSNVSFVIHYNVPKNMESYYQEAGRAGRDGQPADCILLYSGQDVRMAEFLIERSHEAEDETIDEATRQQLIARDRERLRQMTFYCTTTECLRHYILRYFGENSPLSCGHCSSCDTNFEEVDATMDARKILSCVYRLDERGRAFGKTVVSAILTGSKNEKITQFHLDTLSTYNIMPDSTAVYVRRLIDMLLERGYLIADPDRMNVLVLARTGNALMRGRGEFRVKLPKEKKPAAAKQYAALAEDVDEKLFDALRDVRTRLAARAGVPPYVIFSNATLTDMAVKQPSSEFDLLSVRGVGDAKARRYGKEFLAAIQKYRDENLGK